MYAPILDLHDTSGDVFWAKLPGTALENLGGRRRCGPKIEDPKKNRRTRLGPPA